MEAGRNMLKPSEKDVYIISPWSNPIRDTKHVYAMLDPPDMPKLNVQCDRTGCRDYGALQEVNSI